MRFNNRAFSEAEQLTRLVAIDGNTSGFIKDTEGWRVLAASAIAVPKTGDTNETALATVTFSGGVMGANGAIRVTALFSYTNSVNNKTPRIRLGGIAGAALFSNNMTTTGNLLATRIIQNRGAQNSQVSSSGIANTFGTGTGAVVTSAVDTSASWDLVISGQLANSGETITLESYTVELKYGA